MANCIYKYKGKDYTKEEFYSLVATTMVQPRTVPKYNKILFPTGNTASKVEGHTTLEEFKKQKEDRIKQLEIEKNKYESSNYIVHRYNEFDSSDKTFEFKSIDEANSFLSDKSLSRKESPKQYYSLPKDNRDVIEATTANITKEINQLKQELERVETEGFGALKPIYNFYENTVTNILNKTYGKDNVKVITDEYGNTWNEITITPKMSETIRLNTPNGKVKYTGDLAIEEKIAEEAYNSKDEKIPTTLIGKFIQSVRNLFRNIFKETNRISRLIRDLNQGRVINQINNQISPQNTNEDTSRIFYQLAPDTTRTKLNNELELFISNLLNRMGVKKMTFKKYLEEYSKANPDKKINMVAFADMMNKIIAFSEARDGTTMPEEAWHFLIEMFWDEPFIKELRNLVDENGIPEFKNTELWKTQSELYKGVYSETIKDPNKLEDKVEKEIIAKLLAQNIYDQFKEEGSLSHRVINVLKKLLNYIAKKLGLKIRLAKITQTEVNTKVNEILNKLNLGLRYGEFNNLISNKFAEPGKEIDINNEEVPAQYKIPGIKDIFSHAAAIKSINFLKARIQQLTNTKTGLYNELLHKQWKEYEQIIKNNISDFEFTNIRDLLEEVNKFKIRNTNSLDVERMKLIDDAVEKLKILSRKKDIDKAKQDQLLKLNLRLGLLRKEYSEKRFSAAIFTFFFGTDGTIDISSEQDEEKVELSSEGAIADLNRTLTFINNVQNNGHELTPERFQMVVDAYAFYEPVINGLHGIFKSGYNFPELTADQNKKLKETMDLLSKVHIKDINDFLIEKSTSSVKAELKRYAEETGTMNDLLAQRLESDTVNLGNISSIRHYFFAASNSNEDWLSIFNRKIVDTLNKIIRRSNDDYVNLVKSLENELKSMSDFDMRSIMEKDENGKVNGYFLNKYNVEKFNKALEEHGIKLIKSLNKELQDNGIKSQIPEDRETRHSWFRGEFLQMYDSNKWNAYLTLIKDNKGIIPQEIKSEYEILLTEKRQYEKNKKLINNIKIKYDREWAKWFNANTMVNPEKDIIIALRKSTMSESEFNMWYNSVVKRVYDFNGELLSEYYRGELSVPSDGTIKGDIFEDPITGNNVNIQTIDYRNEEYDKLNPDVKKVLNKFLEFKKRADLRLGISFTYEMSMRLPQIPRSTSDLVANRFKGLKGALKEGIADVFKERSHTPLFGEELNGNVLQKPRIRFIKKIDNIENISQDLLRTLVQYNEMSINYEEFIDAKPELDGMIHIAKYNKNKQKRDKVFPGPENIRENILTAFNSKFKNIFKKEDGDDDDYLVRKMENLLSSHVYGIKYTDNSNFAKRIGPFMNWFSQYVRNRRLGGNVTSITKGLVSAIVDTIGQSLIKRYTTIEDYTYGMTEYLREQPRMNWELNSLLKTTKIESVANYMDLVGSLSRTSGNHTRNRAIKVISNSIDYGLWGYSDKMLKYPMMVAIGNNLRYYNGKLYSSQNWPGTKEEYSKANTFWSLINSENGKVTFDKTVSESDINYFTNYVKTVSSRLDGQILSTDKGAIYNHPILQLATITTGFLFQQIDLGIKGEHYNYLTNQREIGYLNNLKNFDKIIGFGWNTMNNAEKNAARQLYMFMITAAVLNVLAFTLQAAGADDKPEDNPFRKFLTYTVTGAAIEHLSRYSADDITRYAQTPFSSIDEYNRIVDALTMIPGLFTDGTDDIGKGSLYTGYDRSTKALIRAIPHVRGWYETLWGGYINEYTGLGAQTIGASYHYKNQFIRNNIYNKSYGIGITWPSRVIGNTLGDIVSNSMGYEYELDGFTQMPTKKNKKKTKKMMKTR